MSGLNMTLNEAISAMVEMSEVSQKEVARKTGIKTSLLCRKLKADDCGARLFIDELTPVMKAFKNKIPLYASCTMNGGMFVRLPQGYEDFRKTLGSFQREFAILLENLINYTLDPDEDKIENIDINCLRLMNEVATIRAGIKANLNIFKEDFSEDVI